MNVFTDAVLIEVRTYKVTIRAPAGVSVENVQEMAEAASKAVNRQITFNRVTVTVEPVPR